ncbi:MAG: Acetyltransferase YpeA [Candidatus Heimdallarchaeota archaeon LC_2]|nr:MAG: Acetyltransferase YpeA [Candidatus Heimdallarchaeota archaeon LC_2]
MILISIESFREYTPADYNIVRDLWIDVGLILGLSDKKDEILILVENQGNKFFLLEQNSEIIGTVICSFDGRRGYIQHVAVRSEDQNKGYGKILMQKALDYFKSKGLVKVHLMVEKSNSKVVEYYKKLGWHIRDDLFLMSKILRDEKFRLDE